MLNQKKLSLLMAAGLAVSLSAFPVFADDAQGPPPGDAPGAQHERGGPRMKMFDRLETELNLTDNQKPTVDPILKDAQSQADAIREDRSVKPEDKRAQTVAIAEGLPDKLNPSLDATQQACLAKFIEGMKNAPARSEGGPRGQHGNRPAPPPDGDQPNQDMGGQDN